MTEKIRLRNEVTAVLVQNAVVDWMSHYYGAVHVTKTGDIFFRDALGYETPTTCGLCGCIEMYLGQVITPDTLEPQHLLLTKLLMAIAIDRSGENLTDIKELLTTPKGRQEIMDLTLIELDPLAAANLGKGSWDFAMPLLIKEELLNWVTLGEFPTIE